MQCKAIMVLMVLMVLMKPDELPEQNNWPVWGVSRCVWFFSSRLGSSAYVVSRAEHSRRPLMKALRSDSVLHMCVMTRWGCVCFGRLVSGRNESRPSMNRPPQVSHFKSPLVERLIFYLYAGIRTSYTEAEYPFTLLHAWYTDISKLQPGKYFCRNGPNSRRHLEVDSCSSI